MPRRGPYQLVANPLSTDTVEALQALLHRAERGELIGLAYVVMYTGRAYTAGAAGECRRNPTFTRGMIAHLDDALGDLIPPTDD